MGSDATNDDWVVVVSLVLLFAGVEEENETGNDVEDEADPCQSIGEAEAMGRLRWVPGRQVTLLVDEHALKRLYGYNYDASCK